MDRRLASARAVADAVLYEGYLLYPYRRSSSKNRVRWQFGVLAPRAWIEARGTASDTVAGSADAWRQRSECLLEHRGPTRLWVRLRFLQLQHRAVRERGDDGRYLDVDTLEVAGQRHLSFDEALPREFDVVLDLAESVERRHVETITVPGGQDIEQLGDAGVAGEASPRAQVVRTRWPLAARVRVSVEAAAAPFPLHRLRVEIENAAADLDVDTPRPRALRRCLVATHCLLHVPGGAFVSLLDPPAWADAAAKECRNVHTFPVLAAAAGGRDVMLSSPIPLYDHPQVAPESPGDLFDATEIDEILSLRTLTLTEAEKREARATDPRVAAILERVDTLPREVFARLHGAVRSLRPLGDQARADAVGAPAFAETGTDPVDRQGRLSVAPHPPLPAPTAPWWDPGADASVSPRSDAVLIDGVRVSRDSRVRLAPKRTGADAHDMFLAGRTARVQAILVDIDHACHLAVSLEDDPGADLQQWYGRYHYFAPDEVVPLEPEPGGAP